MSRWVIVTCHECGAKISGAYQLPKGTDVIIHRKDGTHELVVVKTG